MLSLKIRTPVPKKASHRVQDPSLIWISQHWKCRELVLKSNTRLDVAALELDVAPSIFQPKADALQKVISSIESSRIC